MYRVWAERNVVYFLEVEADDPEDALQQGKDWGVSNLDVEFDQVLWDVEELDCE